MSIRNAILGWSERGAIADARAALDMAGALPHAQHWRAFLDRLLLWSGAVALAAAMVFFIAHNWNDLGKLAKFALVEALVLAAALGYWRLGPEKAAGKASLLVACILFGALLALFGQTYQTGADTWELFANWAGLIAAWVIVGRFAALWILWLAVANVAIVLYFQVRPGALDIAFASERALWTLFAFDTAGPRPSELCARRFCSSRWRSSRWRRFAEGGSSKLHARRGHEPCVGAAAVVEARKRGRDCGRHARGTGNPYTLVRTLDAGHRGIHCGGLSSRVRGSRARVRPGKQNSLPRGRVHDDRRSLCRVSGRAAQRLRLHVCACREVYRAGLGGVRRLGDAERA